MKNGALSTFISLKYDNVGLLPVGLRFCSSKT